MNRHLNICAEIPNKIIIHNNICYSKLSFKFQLTLKNLVKYDKVE